MVGHIPGFCPDFANSNLMQDSSENKESLDIIHPVKNPIASVLPDKVIPIASKVISIGSRAIANVPLGVKVTQELCKDKSNENYELNRSDGSHLRTFRKEELIKEGQINYFLKLLVVIGLKRVLNSDVEKLQKEFSGLEPCYYAKFQVALAKSFFEKAWTKIQAGGLIKGVTTQQELEGIRCLIRHRENFFEYYQHLRPMHYYLYSLQNPFKMGKNEDIFYTMQLHGWYAHIQKDIQSLSDPKSERVQHLGNNISYFVIPGGHIGHFCTYEFRKENDNYYFLVHDKSRFNDISVLHSLRLFTRTTISFQTTKEVLMDHEFLNFLFEANFKSNEGIDFVNYFAKNNKGTLVETNKYRHIKDQLSRVHLKTSWEKDVVFHKIAADMKACSEVNSVNVYGTCVSSNSIPPERQMAPLRTRLALRLFTLQTIVNQIKGETLTPSQALQVHAVIAQVNKVMERIMVRLNGHSINGRVFSSLEEIEKHLHNKSRGTFVFFYNPDMLFELEKLKVCFKGTMGIVPVVCLQVSKKNDERGFWIATEPPKFYKNFHEIEEELNKKICEKEFLDYIDKRIDPGVNNFANDAALAFYAKRYNLIPSFK